MDIFDVFEFNRPLTPYQQRLVSEAKDIIENPKNPKHELFAKGDRRTHEHVQALYAKAFPGSVEI